jgi:uncharacterized protein YcnI
MFAPSNNSADIRSSHAPRPGRLPLAALCAILTTLFAVQVASAHVTVNPREVPPDSNQTFTVRVPTEKEEATVKVRVEFPAGLTVSRFQPKPGWTREVERDSQQRITAVTWSGGQVGPGEYDEFAFIGRTPKEGAALSFKAYQTYQGGETVEWVGAEGTERPAALVKLASTAAAATTDHGGSIEGAGGVPASAATSASSAGNAATAAPAPAPGAPAGAPAGSAGTGGGSDLSLLLALGSGVLALIALVLSAVGRSRRPRPA